MDTKGKLLYTAGTVVALWLGIYLAVRYDRPAQILAATVGAVAVASFVAFYQDQPGDSASGAMRRAIAGSVVIVWFVFFALVVFSPTLQGVADGRYRQTETNQQKVEQGVKAQAQAAQAVGDAAEAVKTAAGALAASDEATPSLLAETTPENGTAAEDAKEIGVARALVDDFRWVMIAVVGFYFTSEGALAAIKAWKGQAP